MTSPNHNLIRTSAITLSEAQVVAAKGEKIRVCREPDGALFDVYCLGARFAAHNLTNGRRTYMHRFGDLLRFIGRCGNDRLMRYPE